MLQLLADPPFFGGPGNDYSLHAVASMVERLRARREIVAEEKGSKWRKGNPKQVDSE